MPCALDGLLAHGFDGQPVRLLVGVDGTAYSSHRPDTMTDIERAARLVYLQSCAYGGKPDAVFAIGPCSPSAP